MKFNSNSKKHFLSVIVFSLALNTGTKSLVAAENCSINDLGAILETARNALSLAEKQLAEAKKSLDQMEARLEARLPSLDSTSQKAVGQDGDEVGGLSGGEVGAQGEGFLGNNSPAALPEKDELAVVPVATPTSPQVSQVSPAVTESETGNNPYKGTLLNPGLFNPHSDAGYGVYHRGHTYGRNVSPLERAALDNEADTRRFWGR